MMITAIAVKAKGKTMSEYINKEEAMKDADTINPQYSGLIRRIKDFINAQPTIELVRCKDCKYRKKVLNCSYGECMYSACMVTDNDFCSNGEAKTNGQEQWDV